MKRIEGLKYWIHIVLVMFIVMGNGCGSDETDELIEQKEEETTEPEETEEEEKEEAPESDLVEGVDYFLPNVALNNWKVTLPVGNPTEVEPPEILDYGTNETLLPYMYNDSTDGSLVFYTYPGATIK